ncbi:hypothetical protein [Hubei picorna-like virus 9]|uniref:hypothetical protein n=1 Tax=Hubei picorna-like virus 9 TaxID=1923168 RepID=UPI00090C1CBC|nr:hypothetical protein [Hubei picorna-like virus 9]APG77979.1 hypothetical protein [Hubei picorna-like virus 9]
MPEMEEFEDVLFEQGTHVSGNVRFRNGTTQYHPWTRFDNTIGEWSVMGFDVSNEVMLQSINRTINMDTEERIKFFTPQHISTQVCTHQSVKSPLKKCPCLVYEKTSTGKFTLDSTLFVDLELIRQEIVVGKELGQDVLSQYRGHKAVILALTTQDSKIKHVENHIEGLRRLYAIRAEFGFDKDFGQRYTVLGEFSAQFNSDWMTNLINMLKDTAVDTAMTLKQSFVSIFNKAKDIVTGFFQLLSKRTSEILNKVMEFVVNSIWKAFSPIDRIKKEVFDMVKAHKFLTVLSIVMLCMVLDMIGFLSTNVTKIALRKLSEVFAPVKRSGTFDDAYAQGDDNPIVTLITILGTCLGIAKYDLSTVSKRSREILNLINFGKSATGLVGTLLVLAPVCVRDLVNVLTQSPVEKERASIESWMTRAHSVIAVSRIPKVLVSPNFETWLNELYRDGRALRLKLQDASVRAMMMSSFNQVLKLKTLLATFKNKQRVRRYPHSVHFCGPPGISKTVVCTKIIRDAYGNVKPYARCISDKFWSGFTNENFIIIDEFLATTKDTSARIAEEYLGLVSTAIFQPEMPTVDDPSTGIKGTAIAPRGVLTINNHPYTVIPGINREAIYRRRRFVVEVKIAPGFEFRNNFIDFSKLTDEQIASVSWLRFDIKPPSPELGENEVLLSDLTYAELIRFWTLDIADHELQGERLNQGLHEHHADEVDVEQILADEMRTMYGIPNAPLSVKEALMALLTGMIPTYMKNFFTPYAEPSAQGRTRRTRPKAGPSTERDDRSTHPEPEEERTAKIRKNKVKWNSWIKAFNAPNTPEEQRKKLWNDIHSGFNSDFLGEEYINGHGKMVYDNFKDVASDYSSCESEVEAPPQTDYIADYLHTNVDYTRSHRHDCSRCNKPYGHKHGRDMINHPILCKDCEKIPGAHENLHSGPNPENPKNTINRKHLFPMEHLDTPYLDLTPEERVAFDRRILRSFYFCGGIHDEFFENRNGPTPPDAAPEDDPPNGDEPSFNRSNPRTDSDDGEPRESQDDSREPPRNEEQHHERFRESFRRAYAGQSQAQQDEWEAWRARRQREEAFFRTLTTAAEFIRLGISVYLLYRGLRAIFAPKQAVTEPADDEVSFSQGVSSFNQSRTTNRPRGKAPRRTFTLNAQGTFNHVQIIVNGVDILGFPLQGSTVMTFHHSLANHLDDMDTKITFCYKSKNCTYSVRQLRIVVSSDSDLVFITLPVASGLDCFANMVKNFWSDNDVARFEGAPAILETPNTTFTIQATHAGRRTYSSPTGRRILDTCIGYLANTKIGDCGAMVYVTAGPLVGRYIGMHVAGGHGAVGNFGIATPITREMITEALSFKGVPIPEDIDFDQQGPEIFAGPNLKEVGFVPYDERVHVSRKSKLQPSAIAHHLPWTPKKELPLMSPLDPRCEGQDPMVNMINDTLSVTQPEIDHQLLEKVTKDMFWNLNQNMQWPFPQRMLTIEEAIGGVPGLLASMKVQSGAGFPLCTRAHKKGKRDFFYFDDHGALFIEPSFRIMVDEFMVKLFDDSISVEDFNGRFLVYLKDELATPKKVREKRTRIIFGGDVIANVAFRMLFGSYLIAFTYSNRTTSSSVGLNQYSHDMELIYQKLTGRLNTENFIAGDFKNFDKKMVKEFRDAAYEIISRLCPWIPKKVFDKFFNHQTQSPIQFAEFLIWLFSGHWSGCFLTTPINVEVHELYIRYIFDVMCLARLGKFLVFEKHVKTEILGDDHIYNCSDEVKEFFNPVTIAAELAKIGQTYTSDDKDAELTEEHRAFENITFLGAHPKIVDGAWCGALRKETLLETLLWTRNHNETLLQECETAMELMSVWGEEDYTRFVNDVNRALTLSGYEKIDMPHHETMARIVAARTAASKDHFLSFSAQGPDFGLTKLNETSTLESTELNTSNVKVNLMEKAIAERPVDLAFSTESNVWRSDFEWTMSDPAGTSIYSIDVPFGLLQLGESDNIQNMPFERYSYWNGDVRVSFQINGQPFQQGLLCIYFMPLAGYEAELANLTTTTHVLMSPGESSTVSIDIPYIYFRSVMSTYASATESLGTIYVTPLSALLTAQDESKVTISVFSQFPNSTFTVPKIDVALLKHRKVMWSTPSGEHETQKYKGNFMAQGIHLTAQGAGQSTSVNNTYYNAGGYMPIQDNPTSIGQSLEQQLEFDLEADVSAMPLDNPPLCSGSIPMHPVFSGMSASHGVRPTVDLQLYPSALSREPMEIFNPVEAKIDTLIGKKCLLSSFRVKTTDPIGKELYTLQLNTRMGLKEGVGIPVNIALLNQMMFWRCDAINFEIVCVKTPFHSMRATAVVSYGVPVTSQALRTVAFSHMMDFSGERSKFDFGVNWNQQTEYLRTYEGEEQVDPVQNYSLGTLSFFLTNQLVAPDSVANEVEVLVFVRFDKPRVAVPRPISPFTFNDYNRLIPDFYVMKPVDKSVKPPTERVLGTYSTWETLITNVSFPDATPAAGAYKTLGDGLIDLRTSETGVVYQTHLCTITDVIISATLVTFTFTPALTTTQRIGTGSTLRFEDLILQKDTPILMAQGNDIPPTQEDGVQPQDEQVDVKPTTESQSPTRKVQACKLGLGHKFEFLVSDVHEIGRRYVRIKPVNNTSLDQFAVFSSVSEDGNVVRFLNISVQVQSWIRALFAVWAGGVKYRIFDKNDNVGNVVFAPFLNTEGKVCVPVIDAIAGNRFAYDGLAVTSSSAVAPPMAREKMFPLQKEMFIDVSCPFQSHFNFCLNSKTQDIAPISTGTLAISYKGDELPEIYSAFADDLRVGVYRPPQTTRFSMSGFVKGFGGFFHPMTPTKTTKA